MLTDHTLKIKGFIAIFPAARWSKSSPPWTELTDLKIYILCLV